MKRYFSAILILGGLGAIGGLLSAGAPAQSVSHAGTAVLPAASEAQVPRIASFVAQRLDLPSSPVDPFEVIVELGGKPYELRLAPHTCRAVDFRVLVQGDDGQLREEPAPRPRTYRGTVTGLPDSVVAASLLTGGLRAYIELEPDQGGYCIQPASELTNDPVLAGMHVSFRLADVAPGNFDLGNDYIELPTSGPTDALPADGGVITDTGDKICDIAFDADLHYFYKCGSSIPNTVADIESVMDVADMVYERDTGINYEFTTIIVRSSYATNPYTSSDAQVLLCQFRNLWIDAPYDFIRRDVAELYTGRDLTGYTIGLAFLGTVCQVEKYVCYYVDDAGYNLVESHWQYGTWSERVALSCHELGHNWNATHCSGDTCHIMCDTMDGCGGVQGDNLKFGPQAQSEIKYFKGTRWCLTDEPDPVVPPFFDEFPNSTLDPDKWTYNFNAKVYTDGVGEPSTPYAVGLNAISDDDFHDDEIRTNMMLLAGQDDFVVSYWTEHRGVEAGEKLVVEYWSGDLGWNELAAHVSDGVDEDAFTQHTHDLPADAYHNDFRLRFRVEADDGGDLWFVDDLYVGQSGSACPEDINGDGVVDVLDLLAILGAWGPCPGCPEDINGDDVVDVLDLLAILGAWGPC